MGSRGNIQQWRQENKVFCWLVQSPASQNENSRPNLSLGKTQNQVPGHFTYVKIVHQPKKGTWQERFGLAIQLF